MPFLTLKVTVKVCEFACQFYKNSNDQHIRDLQNDSSDSYQYDPDDYCMVSREQYFSKNVEHNIDDSLNWAIVANCYQSNERCVDLEKQNKKVFLKMNF